MFSYLPNVVRNLPVPPPFPRHLFLKVSCLCSTYSGAHIYITLQQNMKSNMSRTDSDLTFLLLPFPSVLMPSKNFISVYLMYFELLIKILTQKASRSCYLQDFTTDYLSLIPSYVFHCIPFVKA